MDIQPLLYRDAEARKRAGGISRTTLYRWTEQSLVPPAIVINGQNYRPAKEFDEALFALGAQQEGEQS